MFCGDAGSKSRLAKAAAEPFEEMRDKRLHAGFGALLGVEVWKKCTPLWRKDAQSTFRSQNVQSTSAPDHSWKLRCGKSACHCGAQMCPAHFEVKHVKIWRSRTTFGTWNVEKMHATVVRSTFPSQNGKKHRMRGPLWTLRCRKGARRCGAKHISKSKWLRTPHVRATFGRSRHECNYNYTYNYIYNYKFKRGYGSDYGCSCNYTTLIT